MELLCDLFKEPEVPVPNPHARVTTPRTATIAAVKNIKDIAGRKKEMIWTFDWCLILTFSL